MGVRVRVRVMAFVTYLVVEKVIDNLDLMHFKSILHLETGCWQNLYQMI